MMIRFKRELIGTNANKLLASLSERIVVDRHGCHTPLNCDVLINETKTRFLRYTGYLTPSKHYIKQDLLLILILVRQQNFINC